MIDDTEKAAIGLASIGSRLYNDTCVDAEPESIVALEREAWAPVFMHVWQQLADAARKRVHDAMRCGYNEEDRAFVRALADAEHRNRSSTDANPSTPESWVVPPSTLPAAGAPPVAGAGQPGREGHATA